MQTHNGTPETSSDHHRLDAQVEALKTSIRKLIERASTTATGEPTRIAGYANRATDAITAHPFAAIGVALGLGFLTARIARRAR
jgi:ElaB/YqjD/DUF883 family membrane-anchored ribosome-binding protein